MAMNWIIAGGGTGGHVTPALALGEAIAKERGRVLFLGSDQGLEARLVPEAGFDFVALPSRQVMGRNAVGRAAGILRILGAAVRARRVFRDFGPDGVVSVGGYAAMPATLAAAAMRVPLFLVEPNAIPGRVNRLSARFAARVFVGFDSAARNFSLAPERVECRGVPLREELVRAFPDRKPRRKPDLPLRLLVFGGSQGARQLNEAMIAALPKLAKEPLEIFHQAGAADRKRVEAAYAKTPLPHEVVDFESDMPGRYRWAHVALCRAGALTVAELALAGLPSLLVPYPFSADRHQDANAKALADAGAARVLDGLGPAGEGAAAVGNAIQGLIRKPETLEDMSAAALSLSRPAAAQEIVAECSRWMENRS